MKKLTLEDLKYYNLTIDVRTGIITAKYNPKARFKKEEIKNEIKDTLLDYCKKYKNKDFISWHYDNNCNVSEMFNYLLEQIRADDNLVKEFIGEV